MNSFFRLPLNDPFAKSFLCFYSVVFLSVTSGAAPVQAENISTCAGKLKKFLKDKEPIDASTCPTAHALSRWVTLRQGAPSFPQIFAFLKAYPAWPTQDGLRRQAEHDLLKKAYSPQDVKVWFERFPPLSSAGVEVLADVLQKEKNSAQKASRLVAAYWHGTALTTAHQSRWLKKYGAYFSSKDHFIRASFLLTEKTTDARASVNQLIPYLTRADKIIIQNRLDLQENPDQASMLKAGDPGLLHEHIRALQSTKRNEDMLKMIHQVGHHISPEKLWVNRNLLTRRLMDEKRFKEAYALVKNHKLMAGEAFALGEWLAGWLALRYLNQPQTALTHFQHLYKNVSSPLSVSRAAYWVGKAYTALKKPQDAKGWYEKAAAHPETYYGQLAHRHLHNKMPKIVLKDGTVPPKMLDKPLFKMIALLTKAEAPGGLIMPYILAAPKYVETLEEKEALVTLVAAAGLFPGVLAAKTVTTTHAPRVKAAFPRLPGAWCAHAPADVSSAIIHAIIRQESRFQADAVSSAGAQGMMQLMPATAAQTCRAEGLRQGPLHDPKTNITIGSHHLKQLLARYKGSLTLTAAAYNAGAQAVDEWLALYGDPRTSAITDEDWVELIPYAETRNYVQRVRENAVVYGLVV